MDLWTWIHLAQTISHSKSKPVGRPGPSPDPTNLSALQFWTIVGAVLVYAIVMGCIYIRG